MNISFIDCKDQSVKIIGKTDMERRDHVALVFIHWFYFGSFRISPSLVGSVNYIFETQSQKR